MRGRHDDRGPWGSDFSNAIDEAAHYGHVELIKWLHERGLSSVSVTVHLEDLQYHFAAEKCKLHKGDELTGPGHKRSADPNGLLATVEWVHENIKGANTSNAMAGAARHGDLYVLRWLHQRQRCLKACWTSFMDAAVSEGGHFHVVGWLLENCNKGCSRHAARDVAQAGNLPMLQWLHKHHSDRFDSGVMDSAAAGGHLEMVKWLHAHRSEGCTSYAMTVAAINGFGRYAVAA
jgi:hypothetical protein